MNIRLTDASAQKAAQIKLRELESIGKKIFELISNLPSKDLLGRLYSQRIMESLNRATKIDDQANSQSDTQVNQLLLEYMHAVLATTPVEMSAVFSEEKYDELYELARKMQSDSSLFVLFIISEKNQDVLEFSNRQIWLDCILNWLLVRGNRYHALEGEFYAFVLTPHKQALGEVYGVNVAEIADGFQKLANCQVNGISNAAETIQKLSNSKKNYFRKNSKISPNHVEEAQSAFEDLLYGGITNVSRHTNLPTKLLDDLAFKHGEETEFFATGDFSGTPFRTLPVRKKPFIKIDTEYYSLDPYFARDSGYRALLHSLLQQRPEYKQQFEVIQKNMSEGAFTEILGALLPAAHVYREIYYKDPTTKNWAENDTLVIVDDVLYLIEAKAGAAATIVSPVLDFQRHARAVQDLVVKAFKQCERFFNYLASKDEVPIYQLEAGRHREVARLRLSEFRVLVPIGLTVESFSPFAASCKELPEINPLLGKHAFFSLSIDDLFILRRVLPTPGLFAHYIEVRQAVAAKRGSRIYDEVDHLGAYFRFNRFDVEIDEQLKSSENSVSVWDQMGNFIDDYFESSIRKPTKPPQQDFPREVSQLLNALDHSRKTGWLCVESLVRNLGQEGREKLNRYLLGFRVSLKKTTSRYMVFSFESTFFFLWMQRAGEEIPANKVEAKSSSAGIAFGDLKIGLFVEVEANGNYRRAWKIPINIPTARTSENNHLFEDAEKMKNQSLDFRTPTAVSKPSQAVRSGKVGRNEPCSCGSGKKFKKCHGMQSTRYD